MLLISFIIILIINYYVFAINQLQIFDLIYLIINKYNKGDFFIEGQR